MLKNLDFDWQINEFMVYCRSIQLREKAMNRYTSPYLRNKFAKRCVMNGVDIYISSKLECSL